MESQMARPHGQSQEQEHHIGGHQMVTEGEGEDEHHHENKSVLKKVKAKAKKIKDTLTKRGHSHNHDHDHIPDDHDLDEEDDGDDPEIHGAPGGKEAGISPILHSLDQMSIYDDPKPKSGHEQNWPTGTVDFYTSLPTGSHDQFSPELTPPKPVSEETFDITRTKEYPQDNADVRQSNQSSYTEKISLATSAIADKAISAKNAVASKLGYGEQDGTGGHEVHKPGDKSNSSTPATAVEKLTPVYEKVPGTGSEKEHGVGGQDKGVSVKDYFAEKLRPGEGDRALSEVISEALHKKKTEQENKPASSRAVTEVISDALHKRKEEPNEATDRPTGKVTESEEAGHNTTTAGERRLQESGN